MKKLFLLTNLCSMTLLVGCSMPTVPPAPSTSGTGTQTGALISTATFSCSNDRRIVATFYEDRASVKLDDGRTLVLPQAISASGARYEDSATRVVFWNKWNTATLEENGVMTYAGCVEENTAVSGSTGATTTGTVNTGATLSGSNSLSWTTASGTSAGSGTGTVGVANPASVNCIAKQGTLTIKTDGGGNQYGVCYFEDNRQCEEWALLNGTCPVGGRRITGYNTPAEIYCAITGGTTHIGQAAVDTCELPNSAGTCTMEDYYDRGTACAKS